MNIIKTPEIPLQNHDKGVIACYKMNPPIVFRKTSVATALLAALFAVSFSTVSASPLGDPTLDSPPHVVKVSENAEWQLWYFQPGTRSEGVHGKLYIDGAEVAGKRAGETRSCALGVFVWHGKFSERGKLWDASGWLPKDDGKIRPSADNPEFSRSLAKMFESEPMIKDEKDNALGCIWQMGQGRTSRAVGAVRIDGKWLGPGAVVDARFTCALGEYAWHGDYGTGPMSKYYGWMPLKMIPPPPKPRPAKETASPAKPAAD